MKSVSRQLVKSSIWLIFLCTLFRLGASPIEVCPKGCRYSSIQQAITEIQAFDTLFIQKGTYWEYDITIRKPMVIIGKEYPIIDGAYQGNILSILSDSVSVQGIVIRRVKSSFVQDHAGIKVIESQYVSLKNNRLEDTYFGIYFQKVLHSTAENNYIEGRATEEAYAGNAIHLWDCAYMRIVGNATIKHRDGIYFEFVDHSFIARQHKQK